MQTRRMILRTRHALFLFCLVSLFAPLKNAEAGVERDRFYANGYFRIMTRPDLAGGDSKLGYWNLYGRLLNEGPWGALELGYEALPYQPGTHEAWAKIHTKIEGSSFFNADSGMGALGNFGFTQMYMQAGNILFEQVTWQLGTLDTYFGDLGLYDMKPAQVLFDTLGLSLRYRNDMLDIVIAAGDAGFFLKGKRPAGNPYLFSRTSEYHTVFSSGATVRLQPSNHFQVGVGGQAYFEPEVAGNRFAPHQTPLEEYGITYEDYYRGEIAKQYFAKNPSELKLPAAESTSASSWKAVGYIGFGNVGPLVWNNLFVSYARKHPEAYVNEDAGQKGNLTIFIKEFTDERYALLIGNEMQLKIIPGTLDLVIGALFGKDEDRDIKRGFETNDDMAASEANRTYYSGVARLQYYMFDTLHLLFEGSVAREVSDVGNLWRLNQDSIYRSKDGYSDSRGLEYGDTHQRITWQAKGGFVINPTGIGVYTRPSLRILYGLQHSNVHNAFTSRIEDTQEQYDQFFGHISTQHWHHVIALEAEGWF